MAALDAIKMLESRKGLYLPKVAASVHRDVAPPVASGIDGTCSRVAEPSESHHLEELTP